MSKLTMSEEQLWDSAQSPILLSISYQVISVKKIGQRAGIQTYPFILTINDYSPTLVKFERSLLVLLVSITVRRSDTDEHVETFLKY